MTSWNIRLQRAYDEPTTDDGYRVLVDRVWPPDEPIRDIPVARPQIQA